MYVRELSMYYTVVYRINGEGMKEEKKMKDRN